MAKILTGKVVSTKMEKSAIVEVLRSYRHPLYQKTIRRHKKYNVHVEDGMSLEEGDTVDIVEIRPVSKNKHFKVLKKH